jgi:hypothetical protein
LADKKFQVGVVDRLIIPFEDVPYECGVDHLLFAGSLRLDELYKGRPDLIDISELFLHDDSERLVFCGDRILRISLGNDL